LPFIESRVTYHVGLCQNRPVLDCNLELAAAQKSKSRRAASLAAGQQWEKNQGEDLLGRLIQDRLDG